jgi:uncharacterized protein
MKAEVDSVELCALLSSIVRAMVSDPDTVHVSSRPLPSGSTMIQIKVARERDKGKLIGKQGRTARSLRIIVQAIGKEQGHNYHLDIEGAIIDSTWGPQELEQ